MIKHSVVEWPFTNFGSKWTLAELCQVARELGCDSIELVDPANWPVLKEYGMVCAIAPVDSLVSSEPPFARGFNNPVHRGEIIQKTKDAIDAASAHEFPNVITFTGYHHADPNSFDDPNAPLLTLEEGAKNCVEGYKEIVGYAEEKGVTLCLEMLNTRDDSSPDHGHPGYQGNHLDYCAEIVNAVASPRLKLLFDFYHVQLMDGDLTRRLRQHAEIIGHVHTAGVPGRHEIGDDQELNYPALIEALRATGYEGFIGHEFMPTGDPAESIREAVLRCGI